MFWVLVSALVLNMIRARRGEKGREKDDGEAEAQEEEEAYRLRTRISILIPEMKATSFPVLATRTPMCQSGTYPGAVSALSISTTPRDSYGLTRGGTLSST